MNPPIRGMTVTPYYDQECHDLDQWQAFIGFLYYVIGNFNLMEQAKRDLDIKTTMEKKDIPRFADWVTINLWGLAGDTKPPRKHLVIV